MVMDVLEPEAAQTETSTITNLVEDLLESVNSSEETIYQEGFNKGQEFGTTQGNQEGWVAGVSQGVKLTRELSTYEGFCSALLLNFNLKPLASNSIQESQRREKIIKLSKKLISSVQKFPLTNVDSEDLVNLAAQIRGQFSVVKTLLKHSSEHSSTSVTESSESTSVHPSNQQKFSF